ncbi:hypothetical protein FRX31_028393, partial [Thalictrum thalictroides]
MVKTSAHMSINANWWAPILICKSDHMNPDWEWVVSKVQRLFKQARFRFPNSAEAIVELSSEKDADFIISLPNLSNWEGSFSFQKWTPTAGSISEEDFKEMGKELRIKFSGIPYHLRTRSTVDNLAKSICSSWVVEDRSINLCGDEACVILRDVELHQIPRVLFLKEVAYRFPVVVRFAPEKVMDTSQRRRDGTCSAGGVHQSTEGST